jgi:hypothetical protein
MWRINHNIYIHRLLILHVSVVLVFNSTFSSSGKRIDTCKKRCVSVSYLPTEATFSISVSLFISQIGVLLSCRRECARVE